MATNNRLDFGSVFIIVITFILFVASLFVKGLSHEILLDSAVFLVSVKIIIMSFKNESYIKELSKQLEEIKNLIKE